MPLQKATLLTSGIMIVCIIGSPLGGWIADWWMKWRIQSRLFVAAIAAILTALLYFSGFHFFQGGPVQYGIFMLAAICSIAYASSAIAVTQDVVHPGLRAISYALCVVTQHVLGTSIGPIVTGALSDQFGIATALKIASLMGISSCSFSIWVVFLQAGFGESGASKDHGGRITIRGAAVREKESLGASRPKPFAVSPLRFLGNPFLPGF